MNLIDAFGIRHCQRRDCVPLRIQNGETDRVQTSNLFAMD